MAEVRPFRGLRYEAGVVGDLGRVLAPPYDVIGPEREAALRESSPFNAVRIEYGANAGDDPDRYEVAARTLAEWRRSGALARDDDPAFYLVEHEFEYEGLRRTRVELTGLVRLEPWSTGSILPHELTRSGPKRDRLELIRACRTNLSPLMMLYSDRGGAVRHLLNGAAVAGAESAVAVGADGDRYRVGAIGGPTAAAISVALASAGSLYVADGHHRYETALDYRSEASSSGSGNGIDYVLASLIALEDEGLLSLPYHRMLRGLSGEAAGRFGRQMDVYFESEPIDARSLTTGEVLSGFEERARSREGPVIAVLERERPGSMRVLRPRGGGALTGLLRGRSEAWASLSPCVFEDALLRPALGMGQLEAEGAGLLSYPGSAEEAVDRVRSGRDDYAVLLDGVPLDGMTKVSEQGERLPPKSTYFYPKLPTGLVFNTLEGDV